MIDESLKKILSGLSSEEIQDVREIVKYFAKAGDIELAEVFRRLPVTDIQAIQTKHLNGEYFAKFGQYMRIVLAYEKPIGKLAAKILAVLMKKELTLKDSRSIKFALSQISIFQRRLAKARNDFNRGEMTPMWALFQPPYDKSKDLSDEELEKLYPEVMQYLYYSDSRDNKTKAITQMKLFCENCRIRVSTSRRREFRKAIISNHQNILKQYLSVLEAGYQLHKTRLDRVVIEVVHLELLNNSFSMKSLIKRKTSAIIRNLNRNRIPKQVTINALQELALEEQDESIDEMVRKLVQEKKRCSSEGIAFNGQIIIEGDFYKAIFTFDPKKTVAPIRLRMIVNIQSIIQNDLFREHPEKREHYLKHTWLGGTETNFIMPEDYDYYNEKEQSVCNLVELTAKNLFIDLLNEHLGIGIPNPDNIMVYVSQWEVCWEEEFTQTTTDDLAYKSYACPGLAKYLAELVHACHPYTDKYANFKFENETKRPAFLCDFPSMDPETPMMQYKIYPKFWNTKNTIMLRREVIPTRFAKTFGMDGPDGLPLAYKVLSNPEYCRETMERLLQLELELNGLKGLGYNERFRKPARNEKEEWYHTIIKTAIFGKKAQKYELEYQKFRDTGILPKTAPYHYRKKAEALKLDRKNFPNWEAPDK